MFSLTDILPQFGFSVGSKNYNSLMSSSDCSSPKEYPKERREGRKNRKVVLLDVPDAILCKVQKKNIDAGKKKRRNKVSYRKAVCVTPYNPIQHFFIETKPDENRTAKLFLEEMKDHVPSSFDIIKRGSLPGLSQPFFL